MSFYKVDENKTEMTETLECKDCQGHVQLDETFLKQVSNEVTCPYCKQTQTVNI